MLVDLHKINRDVAIKKSLQSGSNYIQNQIGELFLFTVTVVGDFN